MVLGGYLNSRSASNGGPFVLYGFNQPAAAVDHRLEARMTHIFVAFSSLDLITTQFRLSPCTDSVRRVADAFACAPYRGREERRHEANGFHATALRMDHAAPGRRVLNVGVDIIYDGCAAGGLKHVRLGHRTIRLRREWLDAWAEAHARVAK